MLSDPDLSVCGGESRHFLTRGMSKSSSAEGMLKDETVKLLQVLYNLWRTLSEASCAERLPLLRAHIVTAGADACQMMLVPRLHVFLPKAGRFEETLAANMALLPGKTLLPFSSPLSIKAHVIFGCSA